MKIKITTLAPVHIGSGNTLSRLDFWTSNGKFNRINIDALLQDNASEEHLKINPLTSNKTIDQIFPQDILNKHKLYELPLHKSCSNMVGSEVKEFIKSKNKGYIPGSSLKGSILSGAIYYIAYNNNKQVANYYNDFLDQIFDGLSNINNGRFSQWLNVTDSNLLDVHNLFEISYFIVFNKISKQPHIESKTGKNITGYYESLKIGKSFESELTASIDNKWKFGKFSPQDILKFADIFYRKIYEEEQNLPFIKLPELPQNGYLLRIGQGSTRFSTSLMLLDSYDYNKHNPKTIKLIDGASMGWVKVEEIK